MSSPGVSISNIRAWVETAAGTACRADAIALVCSSAEIPTDPLRTGSARRDRAPRRRAAHAAHDVIFLSEGVTMPHEATGTDLRPALTVDQWSARAYESFGDSGVRFSLGASGVNVSSSGDVENPADLAALIALANAALGPRDPRKFGRAHVRLLRGAAELIIGTERTFASDRDDRPTEELVAERVIYSQLLELADVIASYLPPPER